MVVAMGILREKRFNFDANTMQFTWKVHNVECSAAPYPELGTFGST